jgi:hypothetical protein
LENNLNFFKKLKKEKKNPHCDGIFNSCALGATFCGYVRPFDTFLFEETNSVKTNRVDWPINDCRL